MVPGSSNNLVTFLYGATDLSLLMASIYVACSGHHFDLSFAFDSDGAVVAAMDGLEYAPEGSPTKAQLERVLDKIEKAAWSRR